METTSHSHQFDTEDLEAASKSAADLSKFIPPVGKRPRHMTKITKLAFVCVVLLVIVGIAGYRSYELLETRTQAHAASVKRSTKPSFPSTVAQPTKSFSSSAQNVAFKYPADWKVVEDDSTNFIYAESPEMFLTAANGTQVKGKIVMSVYQQTPSLPMFSKGTVLAVLPSQIITYTSPATNQQASAYVSFLQYPTTTTIGGLDAVYITGNAGYTQGQPVPLSDVQAVTPFVSVTFGQCANATCTGTLDAMTIASTSWQAADFSQPIMAMLESCSFSS